MAKSKIPLADRFWNKVNKTPGLGPQGECWEWTGARDKDGYGRMKRIPSGAHQFSWETHNGSVPVGLFVLHRCDNPPCIRPDHLFIGSVGDNNRDTVNKGRHTGIGYHRKLTESQVKEIRNRHAAGENRTRLGEEYGVARGTITQVVNRTRWDHVS